LLRAGRALLATDTRQLSTELQWLGSMLGSVRDLDVLLDRLRADAAELDPDDHAALVPLLRRLVRQRSRHRRALLQALDSDRYDTLLDGFEATLSELRPAESEETLESIARREFKKLRRAVEALDSEPTDDALHDLRKHGKRARYAHELSGADKVVRRAKELQDVLGEHQDSVVTEERLRALAHDATQEQALAAGLLIGREQLRRAEARASWQNAWRRLERAAR
jgi:CHAD domain-containing protein